MELNGLFEILSLAALIIYIIFAISALAFIFSLKNHLQKLSAFFSNTLILLSGRLSKITLDISDVNSKILSTLDNSGLLFSEINEFSDYTAELIEKTNESLGKADKLTSSLIKRSGEIKEACSALNISSEKIGSSSEFLAKSLSSLEKRLDYSINPLNQINSLDKKIGEVLGLWNLLAYSKSISTAKSILKLFLKI